MSNQNNAVTCESCREDLSDYLDGALTGHQRLAMESHLQLCSACRTEFNELNELQQTLGAMRGANVAPSRLQSNLCAALAAEKARGTHLPWHRRLAAAWQATLAPLAGRFAAATVATLLLVAGVAAASAAAPSAVEANDEPLSTVTAPRYLYSQVPQQTVPFGAESPVLVEAKIDAQGRVYDYTILSGPADPALRAGIEHSVQQDMLSAVFRPATVLGVPVEGRVVLTYSGIQVRG